MKISFFPFARAIAMSAIVCVATSLSSMEGSRAAEPPAVEVPSTSTTNPTASTESATIRLHGNKDAGDPKSMDILKHSADVMLALKTYRAERWVTTTFEKFIWPLGPFYQFETIVAKKPNLMHYEMSDMTKNKKGAWERTARYIGGPPSDRPNNIFICDGKTYKKDTDFSYSENDQAGREGHFVLHNYLDAWPGFFAASNSPYSIVTAAMHDQQLLDLHRDGREFVDGVVCDKIVAQLNAKPNYNVDLTEYTFTWYFGADGLMRRQTKNYPDEHTPPVTEDCVIHNIQVNKPIDDSDTLFTFPPLPAGRDFYQETKAEPSSKPSAKTTP